MKTVNALLTQLSNYFCSLHFTDSWNLLFSSDKCIPTRKETFKIQGRKTEAAIKHCRFGLLLSSIHFVIPKFAPNFPSPTSPSSNWQRADALQPFCFPCPSCGVWVGSLLPRILTLSMTRICDCPCPSYDLSKNLFDILFLTAAVCTVAPNIFMNVFCWCLIDNDEKKSFWNLLEKHAQFKTSTKTIPYLWPKLLKNHTLWAAYAYIAYTRVSSSSYLPGFPLSVLVKGDWIFFSASHLGSTDVESGKHTVKFWKWRPSENSYSPKVTSKYCAAARNGVHESSKPQGLPRK